MDRYVFLLNAYHIISVLVSVYDLKFINAEIELLNSDCDLTFGTTLSLNLLLGYLHRSLLSNLTDWNISVG